MVGSRFCEQQNKFPLVKADLNGEISVDLTKPDSLEDFFKKYEFGAIILFSAFTDVDAAEKERNNKNGIAWKINVKGVEEITRFCKKYSRKLIFISTDFVFDGESGPYAEDDEIGKNLEKISWYGITKINAEQKIKELTTNYLIVRIAYPYRARFPEKDDFAKQILKKFNEGTLYPMFTDQIITPTYVDDIAPAINLLLEKNSRGTFHIASPTPTTPFTFAENLLTKFGKDSKLLKEGSLVDLLKNNTVTRRPVSGGLLVDKISNLGITLTSWQDGITKIFEDSQGQLI